MPSENRLQRRRLRNPKDDSTIPDPQDSSDSSILVNTIKLGMIGLLGKKAYDSGILKDLVAPMLELGDRFARENANKAGEVMHTIREWSNLKHLSLDEIERGVQNGINPPKQSLFRERDTSALYDLFKDIGDLSTVRLANFTRVRRIMEHSRRDLELLTRMVRDNLEKLSRRERNYYDTDLYRDMQDVWEFERVINEKSQLQMVSLNPKAMEVFLKRRVLTPEQAEEQLRTTGYRQVTLGDVVELVQTDPDNQEFQVKPGAPIDLGSYFSKNGANFLNSMRYFFSNPLHAVPQSGRRISPLSSGIWKDITLDSDIRINEAGNYIDYRMSTKHAQAFIDSIAHDFGLPVVGFNPLRTVFSMTGLDEAFMKQPFLGAISPYQYDPSITGKAGRYSIGQWLEDNYGSYYKDKVLAVIDGDAYISTPNNQVIKVGERLKLHDITRADYSSWINPKINSARIIGGLDLGSPVKQSVEDYEAELLQKGLKMKPWSRMKYIAADYLDMGFQEWRPRKDHEISGLDNWTSLDVWTDTLLNKASKKFRVNGFEYDNYDDYLLRMHFDQGLNLYSSVFGEGFGYLTDQYGVQFIAKKYVTTKEGFKIGRALELLSDGIHGEEGIRELKGFFGQFGSGRIYNTDTIGENFTERTGITWSLFNTLNDQLAQSVYFLGFSDASKQNVGTYAANFLLKRALPVYLATQIPGVINYLSEPLFDQTDKDGTGNRENITKYLMRYAVKPIDVMAHHAMDLVGATHLFKTMQEFIPGTEQVTELPGISFLGIGQSGKEREEYIEHGVDPIRKGRFWSTGNTPLSGGKILYYRPNIYRRVEADVAFSNSKYGSRQEYYENTWFPNLANPLAPLNHFFIDPSHYDYMHYHDRPYLATAPEGLNMPIVGPIFGSTIGQILRPSRRMHQEYWSNLNINPADEVVTAIPEDPFAYKPQQQQVMPSVTTAGIGIFQGQEKKVASNTAKYNNSLYTSSYQAKTITKRTIFDNAGIKFTQRTVYPQAPSYYGQTDNQYELYSTPTGQMSIVDIPDSMNLYNVNQDLKSHSIDRMVGVQTRINARDMYPLGYVPIGNDNSDIDRKFMSYVGEQYNVLGDVAGLRGFVTQQFVTGYPNEKAMAIENSNYAYSLNNDFWEENFGGLGANVSEITRRFIPKRNSHIKYVNPIRNTMPSWMPGSSYHIDFKHGDPYSKIDNGEERLPGEGYERLYGIKNIKDLRIGSSSIGYDKDYIIRHMLNQDYVDSDFEERTLKTGTNLHRSIQKVWRDAGLAFSTEGEIKDERNGILGYYDAMVYDMSSPTGMAIVDIKSTSAKKLEEIRKSGKPQEHHQRQVNYYLWATGNTNSKGYIYYVDKEDTTNTYTVGFNYDDRRLMDTLKNVQDARSYIRRGLKNGTIGRGELYDTLDQFRILADVAPYSQEFKDAAAKLSREELEPEEQEEVRQINKRVTQQKEQLRVYPYKFKTANLRHETVTVKKFIDNNSFITEEYGPNHAIKLAGITVTESSEEKYPRRYPRKNRKGLEKVLHQLRKKWDKSPSEKEYARRQLNRLMGPGSKVTIHFDADPANKFSTDDTKSIRAVVTSRGANINRILVEGGYAKVNENDDSPAGIHARYTEGEIAFGNAMERLTHDVIGGIPFVGSKLYQVKSPYEQYRDREVYGKDFQSWNFPIRDLFVPNIIDKPIGDRTLGGLKSIITGAFIGSLFGRNKFGKVVGGFIGGAIPALGNIVYGLNTNEDREWRPRRRVKQEAVNEYVDTLNYVKNMRLYSQYAQKALLEDHFDVVRYMESQESRGMYNKFHKQELEDYKRQVKLDFRNRNRFDFKYGRPKYDTGKLTRKETIAAINKELNEIQGDREVQRLPLNALKAIQYKIGADKTMYGYNPGDSMVDIMSALPKKDRQYFKYFMDAPEEEKHKILRIAPSYLRRALQSSWGLPIDEKPTLEQYFSEHGLPNADWIGWSEEVTPEDIKVKLVHQQKLDPGEFDIWSNTKEHADQVNVPIPKLNKRTDMRRTQMKLQQVLGELGYHDVQANYIGRSSMRNNNTTFTYQRDARDDVEKQIREMNID